MSFGRGIAEAVAVGYMASIGIVFGAGVFTGWLLFWALPTAWPGIKQWLHWATA